MDYKEYRSKYAEDAPRRAPQKAPQKNSKPILYAIIALAAMLCIIIAVLVSNAFSRPNYVARSVTVEAGRSSVEASDFLVDKNHEAVFADGVFYDLNAVGEYKVKLIVDGKECSTKLVVIDIKAPEGSVKNISVWQGSELSASSCVTDIKDATEVTVSFKDEPDTSAIGSQNVTVILTDGGGNTKEYTFTLSVVSSSGLLYTHYVSELGEPLPTADVFTGKSGVGEYLSDINSISPYAAGIYMLQLSANGGIFDIVLEIKDTKAPTATVTPQTCYNKIPEPSEFVTDIVDGSRVTVSYEKTPDMSSSGKVDVVIVLTDAHGNTTSYSTYFTVMNDSVAPEIIKAPDALEVDTGATIIWRASVEATDDSGSVELSLDTAEANLDVPGKYTVYIVAKDAAGNETRKKVALTVHDGSVTEQMLNDAIKKIEKNLLITNNMNAEEKVYAVFRYVYDNMKYSNTSKHIDWREEAYTALSGGFTGDCFTYCAVSYAIFGYLGFDVRIVERAESAKVEGTGTHFWVLINIGTEASPKWYHFDATPQRSPFNLATYLMTNAQLEAYTKWRNDDKLENYYSYDVEKFPEVSKWQMVNLEIPSKYFE
ncbi:MAG: transglutaminase domain-containing protein [Clostridia bacterium]|nr:transglutaminase domain-containing protein [Clostridia bacterium]